MFDPRYDPNHTLRFWRVGKSRREARGCTDPAATNYNPAAVTDDGSCQYDDYPTLATFNGKLYQAARRRSDSVILTRFTEDGEHWSPWQENGQTPDAISMKTFTPQGQPSRLYQAVRGTVRGILTRYTEDGMSWTQWELHDELVGSSPSVPELTVFNPGNGPRLYLATRGSDNRIYTSYTTDGTNWKNSPTGDEWMAYAQGSTPDAVKMMVFNPGSGPRLYQAIRGMRTSIFVRYTVDGDTWTGWNSLSGGTVRPVNMAVFNAGNGDELYLCIRGERAFTFINTSKDGDSWTGWQQLSGSTPNSVGVAVYDAGSGKRLYQAMGGLRNGIFTRHTEDGERWTAWEGVTGSTSTSVFMHTFNPGTGTRLYQTIRGSHITDRIFTRYFDPQTGSWSQWKDELQAAMNGTAVVTGTVTPAGGEIGFTDRAANVNVPSQAVTHWLKVKIAEAAESSVPAPNAHEARVGKAYHFTALNAQGEPVTRFARAVTVGLRYAPDDLDPADELLLTLKYYDEGQGTWVELPSTVDIVHAAVSTPTEHFTLFAIFAPVTSEPTPVPTATPGGGSSSDDPISPSPVPEPTTVLLFGIGLFGIVTMLLRKKRR